MEESKIKDAVRKSGKELLGLLRDAAGNQELGMESFLKFTLNEARDERQIASSKKFTYDIAIVTIQALMKMLQEERESASYS